MTLTLPIVGDSDGTWGTILNAALTDLDNRVTTNSTATGSLPGIEGDITTLEGQVTSLDGRVTTLENSGGGGGGGLIVGTTATLPPVTIGQMTLATDTGYLSYGASIGGVATRVPWPGSYLGQARQTAQQQIPTGTLMQNGAALSFQTVDSDRLGGFSDTRYVCKVKGMYEFTGGVSFLSNSTGYRGTCWYVDGAQLATSRACFPACTGSATPIPARTKIVSLNVGQYVELYAFQSSGSPLGTVVSDGSQMPVINVKYLGYNGT